MGAAEHEQMKRIDLQRKWKKNNGRNLGHRSQWDSLGWFSVCMILDLVCVTAGLACV